MHEPLYDSLYQFTERGGQMSLPVNQYLLVSEPSIMFATGSYSQADWILPQIKDLLSGRPLDYLFISHMESDECGGVSLFLKKYPKLTVICSSFAAKELRGYGIKAKILIAEDGKIIKAGNLSLRFFRYPSEVHLQDGLLVEEMNLGIFYSSDLMVRHITNGSLVTDGNWDEEVGSIDHVSISDDLRREHLKSDLSNIDPKFIAVGHGCCVRVV